MKWLVVWLVDEVLSQCVLLTCHGPQCLKPTGMARPSWSQVQEKC